MRALTVNGPSSSGGCDGALPPSTEAEVLIPHKSTGMLCVRESSLKAWWVFLVGGSQLGTNLPLNLPYLLNGLIEVYTLFALLVFASIQLCGNTSWPLAIRLLINTRLI